MKRARSTIIMLIAVLLSGLVLISPRTASAEVTELGWPYPPTNIDPYRAMGSSSPCNGTAKPGVVRFRDWLNFWYGSHASGIVRGCDVGGASYHKQGRALDYHVNHGTAEAASILNFLLKTDEYGNQHANLRRWGISAIHYGNQRFDATKPGSGWYTCTSCGPHYDHIHFEFSWDGANRASSWFVTNLKSRTVTCATGNRVTVKYWTYPSGYGPLTHIQSISGYGTYSTQAALRSSPWRIYTAQSGSTLTADSPVSSLYTAQARRGSCLVTLPA